MVKEQSKSQNAVDLYDPTGEKGIQKSPQAFLDCKYKIKFPLNIARANASAIPNRPIISIILFR